MQRTHKVFRFLSSAGVLLGIWFLLSGKTDAFHLGCGAAGSFIIAAALFPWKRERSPFPVLRFAAFVPWELWQILLSNLRVARLVLTRGPRIAPRLIRKRPPLADERGLTLLGCSITLTPGTLTVDISPDEMVVHALDPASASEIEQGIMAARVQKVFREPPR